MADLKQEVLFSDISFYQGIVDWDVMKTKSPAAIIRVGQNLWIDPQFARNYAEAKRVGMKRGIYWFYDSRISPDTQADILINLIRNDLPEMEVFCDWEYDYGGGYLALPYAVKFMKRIEAALPVRVGMYTGYYFFKDHSNATGNAIEYAYLKNKALWIAWYNNNPAYVQIPAPWTRATHWQWTSNGDGRGWGAESLDLDLNYYNGTIQEFNQNYGEVVTPPPPDGGEMGETIYSNGVTEITGRLNESDFVTYIIPYNSIASKTYLYEPSKCKFVENITGYDFVVNFTPFTLCKPNLGLRIGGTEYETYHNYNPYLALDGVPQITHVYRNFKNFQSVSQAFRYIIENSAKNPNATADWNNLNPLRLIGTKSNGDLVIIAVKGRETTQRGWTLHEAAAYGLSLGCNMMVDADSGSSVQQTVIKDGTASLYTGVPLASRGPVAVFLAIKFKSPIVTGTTPPPPTTGEKMLQYDANGNLVRTWIPE